MGFEPTPPKRLVPKTSALDHSATLPLMKVNMMLSKFNEYDTTTVVLHILRTYTTYRKVTSNAWLRSSKRCVMKYARSASWCTSTSRTTTGYVICIVTSHSVQEYFEMYIVDT